MFAEWECPAMTPPRRGARQLPAAIPLHSSALPGARKAGAPGVRRTGGGQYPTSPRFGRSGAPGAELRQVRYGLSQPHRPLNERSRFGGMATVFANVEVAGFVRIQRTAEAGR